LVPARRADISSARILLSFIEYGTSPATIRAASHSTIAVFPTHGSHTRTGLFFVFLLRIERSLSTSSSLQITFSSFFSRASSVRSDEKKSSAGVFESLFGFCSLLLSNGVGCSDCAFPPKRLSVMAPIILSISLSVF
jgi:hypothetical protein